MSLVAVVMRASPCLRSSASSDLSFSWPPSATLLLTPCRKVSPGLFIGRRIEAENRPPLVHFRQHEILERRHLGAFVGKLIGKVRGDDDHAVMIADDDVAGPDRRIATTD